MKKKNSEKRLKQYRDAARKRRENPILRKELIAYSRRKIDGWQETTRRTAVNHRTPWTLEQIKKLKILLKKNTALEISIAIGRTYKGTRTMIEKIKHEKYE